MHGQQNIKKKRHLYVFAVGGMEPNLLLFVSFAGTLTPPPPPYCKYTSQRGVEIFKMLK